MLRIAVVLALLGASGCGGNSSGAIAAPPDAAGWPGISLSVAAGGFTQPVNVANAGDNSGRLFVVEQGGTIRILAGGASAPDPAPFLDISARVVSGGEQGLLGVAFPPGYAAKRYFYVNYTRIADGATVVARYRLLPGNDNAADPATEEILLTVAQPFANHNGGHLAFGPDGFLYIALGDGGSAGDPLGNAQNPGVLLGKMLRIDTEAGTAPGAIPPYAIPASNPFVDNAAFRPEIWALGLRNPWRYAFDRLTGDLYIGDVGQNTIEEIDFQPAASAGGENYGWDIMEGRNCFEGPGCNGQGLTLPVAQYDHSLGECSVTGGTVYRGAAFPALQGIYFYADFCTGRLWGLRRQGAVAETAVLLAPTAPPRNVTAFGEDEAGEVYLTDYATGNLLRIVTP
ncbi:MAG: PQQ-dependent sugar dehydrogenase [Thermodesulfobacteriota bacterium]